MHLLSIKMFFAISTLILAYLIYLDQVSEMQLQFQEALPDLQDWDHQREQEWIEQQMLYHDSWADFV